MNLVFSYLACVFPFIIALMLGIKVEFFVFGINAFILLVSLLVLNKYGLAKKFIKPISVFVFFISIFALLSYFDSISIGTELHPFIPGGDGERYFLQAQILEKNNPLDAPNLISLNYLGYQVILAFWFKIFGVNLFYGLALNYMLLTFTIVTLTLVVYKMTLNKKIAYVSLIVTLFTTPILYMGVLLLKDVIIIFALILALNAIVSFKNGSKTPVNLISILVSSILIGVTRMPYLLLLPMLFLLYGKFLNAKNIVLLLVSLLVAIVFVPVLSKYNVREFDSETVGSIVMETTFVQEKLDRNDSSSGIVKKLIDGYTTKPTMVRILLLPIPVLIQYVTPFDFWSNAFYENHFFYFVSKNLNIIWFGFIGALIFFTILKRKYIDNANAYRLFLFGLFFYFFIAFIYGGVIPRYSAPAILFMIPAISIIVNKFIFMPKGKQILLNFYVNYYSIGVFFFALYLFVKLIS